MVPVFPERKFALIVQSLLALQLPLAAGVFVVFDT